MTPNNNIDGVVQFITENAISETERAKFVILALDVNEGGVTSNQIADFLEKNGLARPNPSRLADRLSAEKLVYKKTKGNSRRFTLDIRLKKELEAALPMPTHGDRATLLPLQRLQEHAAKIDDEIERGFLNEAIGCLENGYFRAGIVLSWEGAVYKIQRQLFDDRANNGFEQELRSRNFLKKPLLKFEQLQRVKESELLICAEVVGLFSPAVKKELETCLTKRNNSGHPNDVEITVTSAAAHVETLIACVFKS